MPKEQHEHRLTTIGASQRATATSIASPARVRHAAMMRSCLIVSALRASRPRSVVRTRAVSALTVAVRSRVIISREMMRIRSAFRVPSALGSRSCAVSVPMTDRAILTASRASDLPLPRRSPTDWAPPSRTR